MTTRFWIGAALGAVVAWYFFTPHNGLGGGDGNGGGVGGPGRTRGPRGQMGFSGFGRWR